MDELEPYLIRENILGDMVKETVQPKRINVKVIKEKTDDDSEKTDDDSTN